jgi:hypothetical protein
VGTDGYRGDDKETKRRWGEETTRRWRGDKEWNRSSEFKHDVQAA